MPYLYYWHTISELSYVFVVRTNLQLFLTIIYFVATLRVKVITWQNVCTEILNMAVHLSVEIWYFICSLLSIFFVSTFLNQEDRSHNIVVYPSVFVHSLLELGRERNTYLKWAIFRLSVLMRYRLISEGNLLQEIARRPDGKQEKCVLSHPSLPTKRNKRYIIYNSL